MKKGCLLLIVALFAWDNALFGINVFAQQKNSHNEKISREEEVYRAFLQEIAVILEPHQQSIELTLRYKRNQDQKLLSSKINRELSAIIDYHLGLPRGIEAYLSVPFFLEKSIEQDFFEQKEDKSSKSGIGDLSFGSKFILFRERDSALDIIGSLEAGMPIRKDYWLATMGLTALKSCDPVIIYAGLSYTHSFERDKIKPGEIMGYNLGVAFMINDKITLGEQVIGSYQTKTEIDSEKVLFSESEPIMLRNSLAYAISKNVFLEPSAAFGLNDDASDVLFNFSYNRRF